MGIESRGDSQIPHEPPKRSRINREDLAFSLDLDGKYVLKAGEKVDISVLNKGGPPTQLSAYTLTSDITVDVDSIERGVGIFSPTSDDRQKYASFYLDTQKKRSAEIAENNLPDEGTNQEYQEETNMALLEMRVEDSLLASHFFDHEPAAKDQVQPDADSLKKINFRTDLTDDSESK